MALKTHRVMVAGMDEQGMSQSPYGNTHFQADCGRIIPNARAAEGEPTCIKCLEVSAEYKNSPKCEAR